MKQLYADQLHDHYTNPRNKGKVENPDFESKKQGAVCGDVISMTGKIENGILSDIKFEGGGCVMSQATASMLTEKCKGHPISQILAMNEDDITQLIGVSLGPTRMNCALLPLRTLQEALTLYQKREKKDA